MKPKPIRELSLEEIKGNESVIVNKVLSKIPIPKNGKNGKDAPSLESILEKIPIPKNGKNGEDAPTLAQILAKIPTPKDGKDAPTLKEILDMVKPLLPKAAADGLNGEDGLDGEMPDHEIDVKRLRIRFKKPDGEWGEWLELGKELSKFIAKQMASLPNRGGGNTSTIEGFTAFRQFKPTSDKSLPFPVPTITNANSDLEFDFTLNSVGDVLDITEDLALDPNNYISLEDGNTIRVSSNGIYKVRHKQWIYRTDDADSGQRCVPFSIIDRRTFGGAWVPDQLCKTEGYARRNDASDNQNNIGRYGQLSLPPVYFEVSGLAAGEYEDFRIRAWAGCILPVVALIEADSSYISIEKVDSFNVSVANASTLGFASHANIDAATDISKAIHSEGLFYGIGQHQAYKPGVSNAKDLYLNGKLGLRDSGTAGAESVIHIDGDDYASVTTRTDATGDSACGVFESRTSAGTKGSEDFVDDDRCLGGTSQYAWNGSANQFFAGVFALSDEAHSAGNQGVRQEIWLVDRGSNLAYAAATFDTDGLTLIKGLTLGEQLKLPASTTSQASLNFSLGDAPTTPAEGDLWFEDNHLAFVSHTDTRVVTLSNGTIVADATVANTVTETVVYTETVSADELHVGQMIKTNVLGRYSTSNGSVQFTARLKIGSTTIQTFTSIAGSVTDAGFEMRLNFTVRSIGGSGTVISYAKAIFDDAAESHPDTGTTTIDTTVSEDITLTIEWGAASAGNTVTVSQGYTEFIG